MSQRLYPPEHRRWNFSAALIDAAGWGLGMGVISHDTFLPLFVTELRGSDYAVGWIKSLLAFGWYVPGVLVAGMIERKPRVRSFVMALAVAERLFLLAMVPLCLWLGPANRTALLWAFLLCWGGMTFTMGCNSPSYMKLIAKTVPPEWRGRLYGVGGALAGLLGVLGAQLAGWLLTHLGYPGGYAACFAVAFFIQTVTVLPLGFMREPAGEAAPPKAHRAADLVQLLRDDRVLQGFIVVGILFGANIMATAFYTKYAIVRFKAGVEMVALFTTVLMVASVVSNLLCGTVGDRTGNKRLLELGLVTGVVAPVMAWMAPSAAWLIPVFALNQVAVTAWGIAQINYVLELCGPERAATYSAVAGLLIGPFRAAAPLLGAWLAQDAGYGPLFGVSAALTLLALVVSHRWVLEPRVERSRLGTDQSSGFRVQGADSDPSEPCALHPEPSSTPERLNA